MTVKLGINGFGRIGRNILRQSLMTEGVEVVAINDLTDTNMLGHLLKYDSVHGKLNEEIVINDNTIQVGNKEIAVFSERDPANIDWERNKVEVVIESTGKFTDRSSAQKHLKAGAKKVIISAPGKEEDVTVVMGVNENEYNPTTHHIISNASCTTNSLAPVAKVLHENFYIKKGFITTVHSYTNDQQILDLPHKDYRRARAAAENIIPTTTGATKAVGKVLPELDGKLNGMAIRVPTPNGSLVDFVVELAQDVTKEKVNFAFKQASKGKLKGIIGYTEEPLVSRDIIGDTHSSLIDGLSTMVMDDTFVKVVAWYDNEMAYSARCVDLAKWIKEKGI